MSKATKAVITIANAKTSSEYPPSTMPSNSASVANILGPRLNNKTQHVNQLFF